MQFKAIEPVADRIVLVVPAADYEDVAPAARCFGAEVICGGAALNQDIIDFFDAIGITLMNGYGITECAPLISCNRNKLQKSGSVGMPIVGEQVKIANPDETGEGEICVKGSNVMLGYRRRF